MQYELKLQGPINNINFYSLNYKSGAKCLQKIKPIHKSANFLPYWYCLHFLSFDSLWCLYQSCHLDYNPESSLQYGCTRQPTTFLFTWNVCTSENYKPTLWLLSVIWTISVQLSRAENNPWAALNLNIDKCLLLCCSAFS